MPKFMSDSDVVDRVLGHVAPEDTARVAGIQRSLVYRANDVVTFGHFEPAIAHFHKEMAERLEGV